MYTASSAVVTGTCALAFDPGGCFADLILVSAFTGVSESGEFAAR
jgi:hypothetical protein